MKDPNTMTDDELRAAMVKMEEYPRFPGSDTYVCMVLTLDGVTHTGLGDVPAGEADEVGRDAARAAAVSKIEPSHAREVLLAQYAPPDDVSAE